MGKSSKWLVNLGSRCFYTHAVRRKQIAVRDEQQQKTV